MNTDEKIENLEASVEELKTEVKMLSVAFKDNIVEVKSDTSGPEAIDLRHTPGFWRDLAESHVSRGATWGSGDSYIFDKEEFGAATGAWESVETDSSAEDFLSNLIADYWSTFRHEWEHVGTDLTGNKPATIPG